MLAAELLLLLRDRRALLLAVVLPTLLYPLIFLGQRWLEGASRRALEERTVRVACDLSALDSAPRLSELLRQEAPIEIFPVDASRLRAIAAGGSTGGSTSGSERAEVAALTGGAEGVLLVARRISGAGPVALRLYFDGANDVALQARRRVDRALDAFQAEMRARLAEQTIGRDPARGLEVAAVDIASAADAGGALLGRILPLLAVIVLLSGGSYAALSAFAGEREAGTLETLLVQPAPSAAIVTAKFTAVLGAGLLTLLLNAASVLACLHAGLGSLPGGASGMALGASALPGEATGLALDAARLFGAGLVFLPATVLLCALLCLVCGRARTFREGQYTLLPLMLVCLVPAGLASQDTDLDWLLAAVPVAGPALALRDALRGSLHAPVAIWMFAVNSVWAGAALIRLARSLDTERLVQCEGGEEETALRSVQSRYALRWAWVAVFLVYVVGGTLQAWDLPWGIFMTLWLLLPPLALLSARGTARRANESVTQALHLAWPRPSHALGAILLAPALTVLARAVFQWQQSVLPLPSRVEHGELLENLAQAPLWMRIFLLVLSPAICEELFFRGALLSGLRRDMGPLRCMAWQALLFGSAHSSIYRFVPTAILALVLSATTLRSRSLLPAILLHATYNGLLLLEVDRSWLAWSAAPGLLLLAAWTPRSQGTL